MSVKAKVAGAVAGAALIAGIGVGIAVAEPTPPSSPTPSMTSQARPDPGKPDKARRSLLRRALHGQVTVNARNPRVIVFQRGSVEKVNATSITVRSADGFTAAYAVDADTRVRQDGKAAGIRDVNVGERVRVLADKDGSKLRARAIGNRTR